MYIPLAPFAPCGPTGPGGPRGPRSPLSPLGPLRLLLKKPFQKNRIMLKYSENSHCVYNVFT